MTIKVYSGLLPGAALETHEHSETTLAAWLDAKGLRWREKEVQPIQVTVNGIPWPAGTWNFREIVADDAVALIILPHGGVIDFVGGLVGKIFNLAFGWLMPSQRGAASSRGQGESLDTASASANQAKMGDAVPELFGRHRRFPDYLTPPRRYFTSPREQWFEFLACIGPGRYQIEPDSIKVGDTPLSALGADAVYSIHEPGADLSGLREHENWYSVAEVGGTSSGTAGLELTTDNAPPSTPSATAFSFAGTVITIPDGWGAFPAEWQAGGTVRVSLPLQYTVTIENVGTEASPEYVNLFSGNFLEASPGPGDSIEFSGDISGEFVVVSASLDPTGDGSITLRYPGGGDVDTFVPGQYKISARLPDSRYTILSVSSQSLALQRQGAALWSGWPAITSAATIELDGSAVEGEFTNPYCVCPAGETVDVFEVDLFFPNGLGKFNDGRTDPQIVTAEIQWRDADAGGGWSARSLYYEEATFDQIGFTERVTLPSKIRPEVRIRRIGAKSTDSNTQDEIQWYGLRSRLPTRTSYPNWTTIAIRVRGGGKLSAQSENQINLVATRILPVLSGAGVWMPPAPTRDISAAMRYIAHTVGYTDADIDADELLRLHNIWSSRGDTFNYVFDETTAKEALSTVLGAGFAEFTLDDGIIRPVRDEPRTVWEQGYSPQNMTGLLKRSFTAPGPDDHDGVEVEFMNAETWTKDVVQCRLPGDQGIKVLKIKADGVTDKTRAWRIGMRKRREMFYQRWNYAFDTELDAMNSRYLSYVPLFDTTPGRGQACLLRHISDAGGGKARLVCTEPLEWEEGESHVVGYRSPDGRVHGPFPAEKGSSEYEVIATLPQPWPAVSLKLELPHIYFGTEQCWAYPALVSSIRPSGNEGRASVQAKNYAWQKYLDDNNEPEPI